MIYRTPNHLSPIGAKGRSMNKNTKREVLSLIREAAYASNYSNQQKLWRAYQLVKGKPKSFELKKELGFLAVLGLGFLVAFYMNTLV